MPSMPLPLTTYLSSHGEVRKSEQSSILDKLEDLLAANDPVYLMKIKEARSSKEYLSHDDVFGAI